MKPRGRAAAAAAALMFVAVLGACADDAGSDASPTTRPPTATTSAATAAVKADATGAPFTYGPTPCPAAGAAPTRKFSGAPAQCIDPAKTYTATFDTTAGTIVVVLDTKRTPGTTNNFVVLSRYKYYDGSKFFRTDPSIGIIQGGGQTNTENPGYSIPDEGGKFTYTPGDLVMARTGAPNSAGAQFFFAVNADTARLDRQGTYVTFGKVSKGLDVLEKVLASHKAQPNNPLGGAPDPPVSVNSVTVSES